MKTIERDEVKRLVESDENVKLIETLPPEKFREYHLPGALNVPVGDARFDEKIREAVPDKHAPVIVYCANRQCDASPKAAERMEELGYDNVFDYEAGKADWKEAGFEVEA